MKRFGKKPVILDYGGEPLTVREISRREGCDPRVVYRYYHRHGDLDGFADRHLEWPKRAVLNGETLTFREIAKRLNCSEDVARNHWRQHGNFDKVGKRYVKGQRLPHLERFYHTLDPSIPLDRCIAAAGYRSVKQFCDANDLHPSLVGCWRKGKLYHEADIRYRNPDATLKDEMVNMGGDFSLALRRIMEGTGCLEWELFPDVFTPDLYRAVYKGLRPVPSSRGYKDTTIERNECRGAIRAVLRTLPSRLREVVELSFGLGPSGRELTYAEIAERYRCTPVMVRRMLVKALRELLKPSRRKRLAEVSPFPYRDKPLWMRWRNFLV